MTFAEQLRQASQRLDQFRTNDLADEMGVQTYKDLRRVRDNVRDFIRRGEIRRISRGVYAYVSLPARATVRQRLWNVIRRMSSPEFTLNDLEQLTGAKRNTIKDFVKWLVQGGYARRIGRGLYRRRGSYEPKAPKSRGPDSGGQRADAEESEKTRREES